MNKSEYSFEAFKSITSEEEVLFYSLGFSSFFIDRITSNHDPKSMISKEEIAKMHVFNTALLGSNLGAVISTPEIGFGFKDDEMYHISYRNYGLADYLTLIKFKESELLHTSNNNSDDLIISQFTTLFKREGMCPYSPKDMLNWIFGDLMFGVILYGEDQDKYYKKGYKPEYSDIVKKWDADTKNSSVDSWKCRYSLRNNRKRHQVTNYITWEKGCLKSDIYPHNIEPYRFQDSYGQLPDHNKWVPSSNEKAITTNPFYSFMEDYITVKRPKLALV